MPAPREEFPPLGRTFIHGFDANDLAYPILAVSEDPRAGGYAVPSVGSATGLDSEAVIAWPNHKFTEALPDPTGQRVLWIYRKLPGPVITDQSMDQQLWIPITTTKTPVLASTVAPSTITDGVITEYKGVDSVQAIKLTTGLADKAALLARTTVWYEVVEHSFPDELVSAELRQPATGVESLDQLNLEVVVRDGYSGPCKARFTETFTASDPAGADITPFFPEGFRGHMTLNNFSINGVAALTLPGGLLTQTVAVVIPKCLHNVIDIGFDIIGVNGGTGTDADPYTFDTLATVSFGTIAATSPTALPHGEYVLKAYQVSRTAFGLWRTVKIEVLCPDIP